MIRLHKKADLRILEMKVNCMKDRKFCVDNNITLDLGKNGHHRASGLGSRSITVVRQADKTLAVYDFCKI